MVRQRNTGEGKPVIQSWFPTSGIHQIQNSAPISHFGAILGGESNVLIMIIMLKTLCFQGLRLFSTAGHLNFRP